MQQTGRRGKLKSLWRNSYKWEMKWKTNTLTTIVIKPKSGIMASIKKYKKIIILF